MFLQFSEELLVLRHDEARHGEVDAVPAVVSLHVLSQTAEQSQDLLGIVLLVSLLPQSRKKVLLMEINNAVNVGECDSVSAFSVVRYIKSNSSYSH